jgi:hypothetical protein
LSVFRRGNDGGQAGWVFSQWLGCRAGRALRTRPPPIPSPAGGGGLGWGWASIDETAELGGVPAGDLVHDFGGEAGEPRSGWRGSEWRDTFFGSRARCIGAGAEMAATAEDFVAASMPQPAAACTRNDLRPASARRGGRSVPRVRIGADRDPHFWRSTRDFNNLLCLGRGPASVLIPTFGTINVR